MITNEEARKAIEKYQKEHPLHFGTMIDVTAISSKEGADIISQTIEQVSKKIDEDTELWCICEMAKMYMQGVRPVYPARQQDEWIPVSERLPEYSGLYLVSIDALVTVANFTGTNFSNRGGVRVEVDAWRTLPESYKKAVRNEADN